MFVEVSIQHGIPLQEKSKHSTTVSIKVLPLSAKTDQGYSFTGSNNPKSSPPKIPCDMVIQNEKKTDVFSKYWLF